jgi:sterol desaturase/sphingolipid hydroxylase (fatty acid hydroxylase superfamily)
MEVMTDIPGKLRYRIWPQLTYPLIMTSVIIVFLLLHNVLPVMGATYSAVILGVGLITFFELYIPHRQAWKPEKPDVWNDLVFMVTIQMLLPKFLTFLVAISLLRFTNGLDLPTSGIWPGHWHIGFQVILMTLISDFLRYWLHKANHTNKTLWKLHAVHHSPKKLYWLNVGRFHPIEKSLQFLFDALPFIIMGVSEEVLAFHFVVYGVNGSLQHSNIELRLGWLNYFVAGPELHRWHHSRLAAESNNNYGNNVIIWDLLFGTYFNPPKRQVGEIGLVNDEYPLDYVSQMKTPFAGSIDKHRIPLPGLRDLCINSLLFIKMLFIGQKLYRPLVRMTKDPRAVQIRLLLSILGKNRDTAYGRKYNFGGITDYAQFRQQLPLVNYEDLRPYIEKQDKEKTPELTAEMPFMFNQTSGTTGKPKYIPVLTSSLASFRKTQQIFAYIQYRFAPFGYKGKILGIASPAVEGYLESGTPYGSASGHVLKSMPSSARLKYAVPYEVFEIADYEVKYYIIARLAIEQDDITYMASANPTTFHKLLGTMNAYFSDIVSDIRNGSCRFIETLDNSIASKIKNRLKPRPSRASKLERIFSAKGKVSFADIWPYFNILSTWLGGSCGISLKSILTEFPEGIHVIEIGYVSSEFRGTITMDAARNEGIPTLHENFFEFAEQEKFENGEHEFRMMHELEAGKRYYIFITTTTGLYRYDMNDIVEVTGKFNETPMIRFVQKGKGVTNITGEKLYEIQLIEAVNRVQIEHGIEIGFYMFLANEENSCYEFYVELKEKQDGSKVVEWLDKALQDINLEYRTKRLSGRLSPIVPHLLVAGTYEAYKVHQLAKGQKEGQFKVMLLQYKKHVDFNFVDYAR